MIEARVGGRQRSFDSGQQAARKERKLSPWTKPLIKEIVSALPTGGNRCERQAESGKGGEQRSSPWAKPLPKEKASAPAASENRDEGQNDPGREERIKEIKDRLSYLGAAKEKERKGSDKKERSESHKAENLGKENDVRVKFEMSFPQFLRLIREEREQGGKPLFLKEAHHPVIKAIDMACDLLMFLIKLFLSPILDEYERKGKNKQEEKEEDESFTTGLIKRLLSSTLAIFEH